jgi:protein TonB
VAIGVLHAGALALAVYQRTVRVEEAPVLVSVSLLTPDRPRSPPAPEVPAPRLEMPAQVVLLPELAWEPSDEAPSINTFSAAPEQPQPALQPVVARSTAPLQISQAEYLRAPVLRYPPAALSARREGSVGLRVLVGEDGHVMDVVVERSSGYAPFDEAARAAVSAALFKPYTVNGEPRIVLVRIPIDFTLRRRG